MMDLGEKPCAWCGERIKSSAVVCRFCQRDQRATTGPSFGSGAFGQGSGGANVQEVVLYHGHAHLPILLMMIDVVLILALGLGLLLLLIHFVGYLTVTYRVTSRRVECQRGIISKRIDTMDLARVQDLRFESSFGRGTIILISSDRSSPVLHLPIPGAMDVFRRLQAAVQAARASVVMQERV